MRWLLLALSLQIAPAAFVTVASGGSSAIADAHQAVVRADTEWQALWKRHGAREAAPAIDFSREMIAAVFLGTRPTGGYRVEITALRREADVLVIDILERRPPPGALVTQALTAPFHIVRLPRHEGPVRFRAPVPAQAPPSTVD